jgi:hypothetical protein
MQVYFTFVYGKSVKVVFILHILMKLCCLPWKYCQWKMFFFIFLLKLFCFFNYNFM